MIVLSNSDGEFQNVPSDVTWYWVVLDCFLDKVEWDVEILREVVESGLKKNLQLFIGGYHSNSFFRPV